MRRVLAIPIHAPLATLALVLTLTVALGWYARTLRVDGSLETLLPAGDPERMYYEEVRNTFGSEEVTVIGVFADDVFAPSTLAKIDGLSEGLADLEGVREVLSLTTVKNIRVGDTGLEVSRLVSRLPDTPEAAAALRARVLATPLYLRNVVSADGRSAGITIVFDPMSGEEFQRRGLDQAMKEVIATHQGPERLVVTGIPTMKVEAARLMLRDVVILGPLAVLLVAVVLGGAFRSARGVAIPLVTALIALTWTIGIMAIHGDPIAIGTLLVPPFLFAVAVAYGAHVVSQYDREARLGGPPLETIGGTLEHIGAPVTWGAIATSAAFLPLALSPIPAVSGFAVYALCGVAAVLIASLTIVPAILVLLQDATAVAKPSSGQRRVSRLPEGIVVRESRRTWLTLVLVMVAATVMGWGVRLLRVGTDFGGFFGRGSALSREHALVEERLAGVQPVYVVVEGGDAESVTRLSTLAAIRELQDFIAALPGVDTTLSLLDYLQEARRALRPEAEGRLPLTQSEVAQLLLLINPRDVRPVVTRDFSRANIVARTRLSGSADVARFVRVVEAFGAEHFPRGVTVRATGAMVILGRAADTLVLGQSTGLWQVAVVLLVVMSVLFRSLRIGLLSLTCIVLPIIAVYGVMGWTGVCLDVAASVVPVIVLGVALVGTFHLRLAVNGAGRRGTDEERTAAEVAGSVGRAMTITTAALAAGFLTFGLSSFPPLRTFGVLAAVTMAVTLVVTLLVTPAFVAGVQGRSPR